MGRHAEGWKVIWRGGIGYARFRHAKVRYCLSTGKSDPGEASKEAGRLYSRIVAGKPAEKQRVTNALVPIDVLGARWLASLKGVLDDSTVTTYELYVRKHFLPHFADVGQLSNDGRLAEYGRMRLRGGGRKTVRKELSALKGWVRWLIEESVLGEMPKWPELPKKATGRRVGTQRAKANDLSPAQVEAFLAALPEWSERGERKGKGARFLVRARFIFAYETGLRPATVNTLDWAHWLGATLRIEDIHDKARYAREVPLSERALAVLEQLVALYPSRPSTGTIFGKHDYRTAIRKAAEKAGIHLKLAPYDFRHARGTHLMEEGASLPGTAFLFGHTQLTTTNKYAKGTQRAAEAAIAASDASRGAVEDAAPEPPTGIGELRCAGDSGSERDQDCVFTVRRTGVEPVQELPHWNLNAVRFPLDAENKPLQKDDCLRKAHRRAPNLILRDHDPERPRSVAGHLATLREGALRAYQRSAHGWFSGAVGGAS